MGFGVLFLRFFVQPGSVVRTVRRSMSTRRPAGLLQHDLVFLFFLQLRNRNFDCSWCYFGSLPCVDGERQLGPADTGLGGNTYSALEAAIADVLVERIPLLDRRATLLSRWEFHVHERMDTLRERGFHPSSFISIIGRANRDYTMFALRNDAGPQVRWFANPFEGFGQVGLDRERLACQPLDTLGHQPFQVQEFVFQESARTVHNPPPCRCNRQVAIEVRLW